MRTLPLFLAAAFLLAGPAHAGPPPDIEQMTDIAGRYALADGRIADLFIHDRVLVIELDGRQEELLPVSPNRYATRDGTLSMRYRPGPRTDDIVLGHALTPDTMDPTGPRAGRGHAPLSRQRCW